MELTSGNLSCTNDHMPFSFKEQIEVTLELRHCRIRRSSVDGRQEPRKIEQHEEHGECLPGESEVRPCILVQGPDLVSHLPAVKYKLMNSCEVAMQSSWNAFHHL